MNYCAEFCFDDGFIARLLFEGSFMKTVSLIVSGLRKAILIRYLYLDYPYFIKFTLNCFGL